MNITGSRLRAMRRAKGFAARRLADITDMPVGLLISIETGRRPLSVEVARRLAAPLGVHPGELLFGDLPVTVAGPSVIQIATPPPPAGDRWKVVDRVLGLVRIIVDLADAAGGLFCAPLQPSRPTERGSRT